MNETEKDSNSDTKTTENQPPKIARRRPKNDQMQILQEALGLQPEDIEEVEKKLFIAKFFDYFKEQPFDFIFKDHSLELYKNEVNNFFDSVENEEDKLLNKKLSDNKLIDRIDALKAKAEDFARIKGNIKTPIEKKVTRIKLGVAVPGLILIIILLLFNVIHFFYVIPLVFVFCFLPQFFQAAILKKWYDFKETYQKEFFTENRDDILTLKDFAAEILENIRKRLLEMKIPLQIIKFILHSRDYENMKLLNKSMIRDNPQYVFNFEYPPGMEPLPIPEELLAPQPPKKIPEANFIVLTELKMENGKIESFVPVLKSMIADKLNSMLNECEFTSTQKDFKAIIPDYPENMAIYCLCGDIAEIKSIQICNWKNQFKFYLFESTQCRCGDKIYALSLIDDKTKIPTELEEIFSS